MDTKQATTYLEIDFCSVDLNPVVVAASETSGTLYVRLIFQSNWDTLNLQDFVDTLSAFYAAGQAGNLDCNTILLLPCSVNPILDSTIDLLYHINPLEANTLRESQGLSALPSKQLSTTKPLKPFPTGEKSIQHSQTKRIALGGTFDHLHAGHKVLLSVAAALATESIVCGLADGPLLVNKKFKEMMEPFETRKHKVEEFLKLVNPSVRPEVPALIDVGGPTLEDPTITGIVASQETEKNAHYINEERAKKDFSALAITIISLVESHPSLGADVKISSTGLREKAWLESQQSSKV